MKNIKCIMLILCAVAPLAGCTTYQGAQGGTAEQPNVITGAGEGYPKPIASPSFQPGMNPRDPRDAHFTQRVEPKLSPPSPEIP